MNDSPKRLLILPQDKGGIGKSFVAALLFDHLSEEGVRLKTFDVDHANSTFNRLVPEAEFIDTDVDLDKLAVLDRVVHPLSNDEADVVLVDSRAAGGDKLRHYLDEVRLPQLQDEIGFTLVFVVIATDDKDANSQLAELIDAYGEHVDWLIVRNLRDTPHLDLYEQSKSKKRLAELGAVEIDMPPLAEVTRNALQKANLTVGRGRSADALHLLDRSRCVRYHERMAEQFAKARELLGT
ncbi:MAG: hypothetical protein Q7S40_33995 [Opitutaceae bacterium]|nr:hypothetical protein [Opitutaceae bacterium]